MSISVNSRKSNTQRWKTVKTLGVSRGTEGGVEGWLTLVIIDLVGDNREFEL